MTNSVSRFRNAVIQGLKKGLSGFIWLMKIVIPISLFTAFLFHFELVQHLNFLLSPVMNLMGLPASAILVIIAGLFTGIYGAIGAFSVMPFSIEHATLMAIFVLIAHNLIQESIVQDRTGLNALAAVCFRLAVAFITTFLCAKIMGAVPGTEQSAAQAGAAHSSGLLVDMLKDWCLSTAGVIFQIFFIIIPLMVVIELAREFHIIETVTGVFSPVLALLGIDQSCGILWLAAAFFGLSYGAAVIQEETQTNHYDKTALTKLHLSIGINHSMIEDPVLLMGIGIPALWLWIPRLIAAAVVVWFYTFFAMIRKSHAH